MIKENTVLILGAGASKPYGFPSATELRDEVIRVKDMVSRSPLIDVGLKQGEYQRFANDLAQSGYESVDAFLEDRQEYVEIGKAAIALNLLRFERDSSLFPPKQPRDHWYEILWHKMKAPTWATFKRNSLSVITFNYDRSLEHYLASVVRNNYRTRLPTAAHGLRSLPILHVHGILGEYAPPQFPLSKYPYAWGLNPQTLDIARRSIKIVHENDAASPEFQTAHQLIENAKRVLFVGFGYRESNMKKLGLSPGQKGARTSLQTKLVVGTHKGYRADQWARICLRYEFPVMAARSGSGSVSDFLSKWLF
jgi:hypothetical protein